MFTSVRLYLEYRCGGGGSFFGFSIDVSLIVQGVQVNARCVVFVLFCLVVVYSCRNVSLFFCFIGLVVTFQY